MRFLAIAAALVALALISGFAAYEWRSSPEPVRVEPVELLPAPEREPRRELPGKRRRTDERPDTRSGGTAPAPNSSGDGAVPVAPTPAGGGDDDPPNDDDGDDGGGDD
jgi:eukaryotic-like serine/threonine-protein kinase